MSPYRLLNVFVATAFCVTAATTSPQVPATGKAIAGRVRMRNGVRVIEHDSNAIERAPRLTVDATPITVLDEAKLESGYNLSNVVSIVFLRDGRIATLSMYMPSLQIFGSDGRPQRYWARQGKGPGDFMAPGGLIAGGGDTLLIPDPGNRLVHWFDPDSGSLDAKPLPPPTLETFMQKAAGALSDGSVIMHTARTFMDFGPPKGRQRYRSQATVTLISPDRRRVKVVAKVPDMEMALIVSHYHKKPMTVSHPLGFSKSALVVVWDSAIVTSSNDDYAVDLRTRDGRIVSRIRVPRTRRVITPAMRDAYITVSLGNMLGLGVGEGAINEDETARQIREQPFADSLPYFDPFHPGFVTRNKTLWIVDPIAPSDSSWSATAFRPDGAIIARLHVPGNAPPVAFGDDRVALRHVDNAGNVSIRVLRIIPSPR
jgi:hypothetical protein